MCSVVFVACGALLLVHICSFRRLSQILDAPRKLSLLIVSVNYKDLCYYP